VYPRTLDADGGGIIDLSSFSHKSRPVKVDKRPQAATRE
jgi:hypothetical protein